MKKTIVGIPEHLKPRSTDTGRLFSSQFLEILTRTHISIPVTLHLFIVACVSYYALALYTLLNFAVLFLLGTCLRTCVWFFLESGHRADGREGNAV